MVQILNQNGVMGWSWPKRGEEGKRKVSKIVDSKNVNYKQLSLLMRT